MNDRQNNRPPQNRSRKQNSGNNTSQSKKDGKIWFDPSCLPLRTPPAVSRLTENIVNYDKNVGFNAMIDESIARVISDLEVIILREFGNYKVCKFGSSVNGFGTVNSDVDCFVDLPDNNAKHLRRLRKVLERSSTFHVSLAVVHARVPIITCTHRQSSTDLDVSFKTKDNDRSDVLDNSALLKAYADLNPKIPAVGRFIKLVHKFSGEFGSASTGGLSSYSHIIMFIHYLIQSKTIPHIPLDANLRTHKPVKIAKPHGDLFLDFLAFYACWFDSSSYKVDIRYARPVSCKKSGIFQIEDPIIDRNLGKCMQAARTHDMKLFYFKVCYVLSTHNLATRDLEKWVASPNQNNLYPPKYYPRLNPDCDFNLAQQESRPSSSQSQPSPSSKNQPPKTKKTPERPKQQGAPASELEASIRSIKESLAQMKMVDQQRTSNQHIPIDTVAPLNSSQAEQSQNWRSGSEFMVHESRRTSAQPIPNWRRDQVLVNPLNSKGSTKNPIPSQGDRENISRTAMSQNQAQFKPGVRENISKLSLTQKKANEAPKAGSSQNGPKTQTPPKPQAKPSAFREKEKPNPSPRERKAPEPSKKDCKGSEPSGKSKHTPSKTVETDRAVKPKPKPEPKKDKKRNSLLADTLTDNLKDQAHWGSMSSSVEGRWGSICSEGDDIWGSAAQEISKTVNKAPPIGSPLKEKLKTVVTWPEDWLVADYHCTGSDFKPLVLIPALAALGVKVPCLLDANSPLLLKLKCIPGFNTGLNVGDGCDEKQYVEDIVEEHTLGSLMTDVGCVIGTCGKVRRLPRVTCTNLAGVQRDQKVMIEDILSVKQAVELQALLVDVSTIRGSADAKKANKLAQAICETGAECGILTRAQTVDYHAPLSNVIGDTLEIEEVFKCLSGAGCPETVELICNQGGMILTMLKKSKTPKEGAAMVKEVLGNDYAHEKFCQMLQAQGACDVDKLKKKQFSQVLPQPKHTDKLTVKQAGFVLDINYELIHRVAAAIASPKKGCVKGFEEWSAGVQIKCSIGDGVGQKQVWAEVHHSGQLSNKLKQELLEGGIVVRPVQVSRAMTTFSSRKVVAKKVVLVAKKASEPKKLDEPKKASTQVDPATKSTLALPAPVVSAQAEVKVVPVIVPPPAAPAPVVSTETPVVPVEAPVVPGEAPVVPVLEVVQVVQPEVLSPESVTKEYVVVEDELVKTSGETSRESSIVPDISLIEGAQSGVVPVPEVGQVSPSKKKRLRKKRSSSSTNSPLLSETPDITTMIEQACHDITDVFKETVD